MILTVGAAAAGGACVARAPDGRVVFVRHALPGETVRVEVTSSSAHFLRADAVEVLSASPERVEPPCLWAGPGRCGGCDWQHVAVPYQRTLKSALVAEQLSRLAGLTVEPVVEPLPGGPLGWRTRVQWAVDRDGLPGLHRHRSAELEHMDRCLIAAPGSDAVLGVRWPGARSVETCSVDGQTVLSVAGRPSAVPVGLPGAGEATVPGAAPVRPPGTPWGIVVEGRPVQLPHGIRTTVLGRSFEVSAGSFWQVHPAAPGVLADAVLTGLAPRPGEKVVDLYAGVGLFSSLTAAAVGSTGAVLAVEADARACADAARNTSDQPWVRIRTATVDPTLVRSLTRLLRTPGGPDLIVLDPPRAGAGLAVTRALAALRPRALAYVSCDPASFARDLRVLLDDGWALTSLRAFDLYPMTEHVELVAVLTPPG